MQPADVPLCVDLDGTVICTDLLLESCLLFARRKAWKLFLLPFWLLGGKARLKRRIAENVRIDAASLPYREDLLDWLRAQAAAGRKLTLVTASDRLLVEPVAMHLGIFDEVIATDGSLNLAGRNKARALVEKYGERGFDYAGNSRVDLRVWAHARSSVVVNGSRRLVEAARAAAPVVRVFPRQRLNPRV